MSEISDECRLSFYEEITPFRENERFWLVRHKQKGKFYVRKNLSSAHREVYLALRGITSQNLPRIYECISLKNEFVVIEELIVGDTLHELVRQGEMFHERAVSIMIDICNVLFILHSMVPPIIHRDIKPENILVTNDGVVKLMDFDIARNYDRDKSQDTEHMGTVGYAAPEHFGFGQTDARSDIYSCGVVLNFLLTGQMLEERMAEGNLGMVVNRCTQINPIHRYQNVFELRQALGGNVGRRDSIFSGNNLEYGVGNHVTYDVRNHVQLFEKRNGEEKGPSYARDWQKFLPPGFRTLKLWKIAVAIFFYCLIFYCVLSADFEAKSEMELILNRIFSGLGLLGGVLVLCNYLGVADQLPGAGRSCGKAFWLLRCIYAFLAFCLMACVFVVLLEILQ